MAAHHHQDVNTYSELLEHVHKGVLVGVTFPSPTRILIGAYTPGRNSAARMCPSLAFSDDPDVRAGVAIAMCMGINDHG